MMPDFGCPHTLRALDQLPARSRYAVRGAYVLRWTLRKLAEEMRLPTTLDAAKLVERGLDQLRHRLPQGVAA